MARVHGFCAKHRFPRVPAALRRTARLAAIGVELVRTPRRSLTAAARDVRRRFGKSRWTQFREQVALARAYGVSPLDYYRLRFFIDDRRALAHEYLYQHEVTPLLRGFGSPNFRRVTDKARFAKEVASAGLPVVSTLAVFRNGAREGPARALPTGQDLFAKPVTGSGGHGAAVYLSTGGGTYADRSGRVFSEETLNAALAAQSMDTAMLVQPRLRTLAELADLSREGLVTLRIVTAMSAGGEATHVLSVLKLPLGSRDTDNNGLASPVSDEGRLGTAVSYRLACEGIDVHPDTGAPIAGRIVPGWPDARALALRAHAHFAEFFALGWDVALSVDGPVLLEANAGWDTYTMQRPHDRPLGRTPLGALATARLERT